MCEVRRNRFADDEPLDLTEKAFFRHGRALREAAVLVPEKQKGRSALRPLPEVRFRKMPAGLADGLGLGSVLRRFADSPRKAHAFCWVPRFPRMARELGLSRNVTLLENARQATDSPFAKSATTITPNPTMPTVRRTRVRMAMGSTNSEKSIGFHVGSGFRSPVFDVLRSNVRLAILHEVPRAQADTEYAAQAAKPRTVRPCL